MIHLFEEHPLGTTLSISETTSENTKISICDSSEMSEVSHFVSPKELNDFIGILLHIQAKKRKRFRTKF